MTMAEKTVTEKHPTTEKHPMPKPTVAEHMKSVKAAWDKAPAGAKKDSALKHYQAAEKAHTAKHDADATKEPGAAAHALA